MQKRIVECTAEVCSKCKYHMRFGSGVFPKTNTACNYIYIMDRSRIFEGGKMILPPEYCDKFEKGRPISREVNQEKMRRTMMEVNLDEFYKKDGKLYLRHIGRGKERDL